MYYCPINEIPKYSEIKMFTSFRVKATEKLDIEIRVANTPEFPEAVCVYKHLEGQDGVKMIYSGRLNENNYQCAIRVLKDCYYYNRTWKYLEEVSKDVVDKSPEEQLEINTVKDMRGNILHVGDIVRFHSYTNFNNCRYAVIEKFASTTIRVLINGKIVRYTKSDFIELITDDTVETLHIKRKDVRHIVTLLKDYDQNNSELIQYLNKVLGE